MFSSFIRSYRNSQITTRVMLFAAVIMLTAAISWINNLNVLAIVSAVAVTSVLIEFFMVRTRNAFLVGIWVLNFIALSIYTYGLFMVYAGVLEEPTGAFWAGGAIALTGALITSVSGGLVHKIVGGKTWIHLVTVFVFYYIVMTALLIWLPETNILVTAGATFIIVLLYPITTWWGKRKKSRLQDDTKHVFPTNKNITVLTNNIKSFLLSETMKPANTGIDNVYGFVDDNKIMLMVSLAGKETNAVTVLDNQLLVDEEDYAWVLEYLAIEASKFSRSRKIRQNRIRLIIAVNDHNLPRKVNPIVVRRRENPDKILGTVLIAKKSALVKLSEETLPGKKLTDKELARVIVTMDSPTKVTEAVN